MNCGHSAAISRVNEWHLMIKPVWHYPNLYKSTLISVNSQENQNFFFNFGEGEEKKHYKKKVKGRSNTVVPFSEVSINYQNILQITTKMTKKNSK